MIDITMPAVIRPEIINITLSSFCKNMFTDRSNYRLILNVDPIGENFKQKYIYRVAQRYFDNIVVNYSQTPGFTKAVKWCWSQVTSEYVFHLEDDWLLLMPINIKSMIKILEKNEDLLALRLSKVRLGKSKANELGFVYCPKISLNPTLFKGEFIKIVTPLMDLNLNPEKQLRPTKCPRGKYVEKYTYGIYVKESAGQIVEDIGRKWMNNSLYTKKTGFMNWERK